MIPMMLLSPGGGRERSVGFRDLGGDRPSSRSGDGGSGCVARTPQGLGSPAPSGSWETRSRGPGGEPPLQTPPAPAAGAARPGAPACPLGRGHAVGAQGSAGSQRLGHASGVQARAPSALPETAVQTQSQRKAGTQARGPGAGGETVPKPLPLKTR